MKIQKTQKTRTFWIRPDFESPVRLASRLRTWRLRATSSGARVLLEVQESDLTPEYEATLGIMGFRELRSARS